MSPPYGAALEEPDRASVGPTLETPADVLPPLLDVSSYRPSRMQRTLEGVTVWLNRGLDLLPGSNWVHRRILGNQGN